MVVSIIQNILLWTLFGFLMAWMLIFGYMAVRPVKEKHQLNGALSDQYTPDIVDRFPARAITATLKSEQADDEVASVAG